MVAILSARPEDRECQILATPREDGLRHYRSCKVLWPLLSIAFLVSVIAGVAYAVQANGNSHGGFSGGRSDAQVVVPPAECPSVPPSRRLVVFWSSETEGCASVPTGVTHIVVGFALVHDGVVDPTFQGARATLLECIAAWKARCITVMASIGGATNVAGMEGIDDAGAFAASALALVHEYGFDGVDIDNESVGANFDASRVVEYMTALRSAFKGGPTAYWISYDVFVFEGVQAYCADPNRTAYSRCFPTALLPLVDWVNIMAYNVDTNSTAAARFYADATTATFPEWFSTHLGGDGSKATLGVCVGAGKLHDLDV
ncbi:carbohydrate-binding protein [Achlya hypogyna]|uniref:Carbohydrate-binding protein n=1 Tax=Achlya hypogyna TaxID=1202772 RepID=A0A1V9Z4Q4_ACHHY|nr:carbohydrate-binding protein [Achlya hypogyna]